MRRFPAAPLACLLLFVFPGIGLPAVAQEDETEIPPGRTHYMGREIAKTMSYRHASWLTRSVREREENTSTLLEQLRIEAGMTLCDMGCGNGYYTLRMARRLEEAEAAAKAALGEGEEPPFEPGTILAVDIQPEMLELLGQRAEQAEVASRVVPVLGTVADPRLPRGKVDLMILVDVYHEFSHPELMLKRIHESLAPGGLIVLAEFRSEDPKVPIKKLHKMSKAQVDKELSHNGFRLVREFDELPWQHLLFYGKAKVETEEDGEA